MGADLIPSSFKKLTLLQVQADHERRLQNVLSDTAAVTPSDGDYHEPLMV